MRQMKEMKICFDNQCVNLFDVMKVSRAHKFMNMMIHV